MAVWAMTDIGGNLLFKAKSHQLLAMYFWMASVAEHRRTHLINLRCNLGDAIHCTHGVEVDGGHTVGDEVATLCYCPLDAYLLHLLVGAAAKQLIGERFGQVATEGFRNDGELRELGEGLDARNDGHIDALNPATIYEAVVGRVVVDKVASLRIPLPAPP